MLVLLPPSEEKTEPATGAQPVDPGALIHPELTDKRVALARALAKLSSSNQNRALKALGLSPGQSAELARNRDLLAAPAAPADAVYAGVLYQHLDLASFTAAARARAVQRLMVSSALWGIVRLDDRIPAYRLNMNAKLPRIKSLAAWWRPALTSVLPATGLVVDMRSQGYSAAWRPAEGTVVEVRAYLESDGSRKVITHMAKATRGEVAGILARAHTIPSDPEEVAGLVENAGLCVELKAPAKSGGSWSLNVIRAAI